MQSEQNDIEKAHASISAKVTNAPRIALVLGSGLSALAETFSDPVSIPYREIAGMPQAGVAGHPGQLVLGLLDGVPVVAMQGRLHPYEGHALHEVVLGVRLMARLGAGSLIATNAAGGLDPALEPGALLAIRDHINLTGQNCLVGANDAALGPRFPDMSAAYDPGLRAHAQAAAGQLGIVLHEGVYAGVLGPSYETPAEVRMLRMLGASVVGMSTVQEVIAARHLGLRVLGLSCVTNLAAGLSQHALTHREVEATARASSASLTALVRATVRRMEESGSAASA
jgi:purine-nucleoside phosphorylase